MAVSPTFLFSRARPIGEVVEICRRHVGLLAGHELVFHFFILGAVEDGHGRAEADFILGDIVHVDQRQVGKALAQLADARLQILLALLGRVILGVLAEVAQATAFLSSLGISNWRAHARAC
jgi:hypothetical protein